jgi:cyclase
VGDPVGMVYAAKLINTGGDTMLKAQLTTKNNSKNHFLRVTVMALAMMGATTALAQAPQDFSKVQIVPHQLAEGLYYLEGSGGNIGVSFGEDGVFLIDDQYAPLSEKIVAAIRTLSDKPIRFIFNTHHHGDHTGGNQNFGKGGAIIVSHENVRTRLAAGFTGADLSKALTPEQRAGLPVITFEDSVDFHLNGHAIHAMHVPPAHTDGDSIVIFKDLNLIHTGDVFRTTSYPRADAMANGSLLGILDVYKILLDNSNDTTAFLPGHGAVSKRTDVQAQLSMLNTIRDRVQAGITAGNTLEQVQAGKPTAEFDAAWSGGNANAGNDLVAVFFNELSAKK